MKKKIVAIISFLVLIAALVGGIFGVNSSKPMPIEVIREEHNMIQTLYGCPTSKKTKKRRFFGFI